MTSISTLPPAEPVRLTPTRIRVARERRGLTKAGLARRLGVTSRQVQTYESDGAPGERLAALSSALDIPPEFFLMGAAESISTQAGFFRALRRASAGQLGAARAAAAIGAEAYSWIVGRYDLPSLVIPELENMQPQLAAGALRALWGRGEEPLPNLVQLCEANGVRVMSLPVDAEAVDAFSFWRDGSPHVLLSTRKSAERSRFDLAHELGHLVMHSAGDSLSRGASTPARELEREADEFASAFLMPERAVAAMATRETAVPEILQLRSHFRVSAMAMARRLHDIGRLSDWGYRQDCVQLAQRGFRSGEPGGMARERSRVFEVVFGQGREQRANVRRAAQDLGIYVSELHALTFGQFLLTLPGENAERVAGQPHLRLV